MAHPFPSNHLVVALRSILQELETDPETQAHRPELENLKRQILLTLTDLETRQQLASPPVSPPGPTAAMLTAFLRDHDSASTPPPAPVANTGVAILSELLRERATAANPQPDALPPLATKDPA